MMTTKYKASKVEYDGIKFDSKLESNIYKRLKELGIQCVLQPKFKLQESFRYQGKAVREINYVADFAVFIGNRSYIIDAKGMETPVFKLKRKLFMFKYGTDIVLIKSVKHFNTWYNEVLNDK